MEKKIALVEDDIILSNVLYTGLLEAGFDVSRAFDGEAGLELVKSEKPDFLLLDIMLPKMDGPTVVKNLKSNPETKDIPIIILTVLEKSQPIADALDDGVSEYIVKSDFKLEEIVAKVKAKFEASK